MSAEIYWLVLTALMTALFWIPYILNQIAVRGLVAALGNPSPDAPPLSAWAQRAAAAHKNAAENLVVFAPLALSIQLLGTGDTMTAAACAIYFFARLTHFVVYTAGIPVVRTLAFAAGFGAQVALGLRALGVM